VGKRKGWVSGFRGQVPEVRMRERKKLRRWEVEKKEGGKVRR
jgi:hypothetical protein